MFSSCVLIVKTNRRCARPRPVFGAKIAVIRSGIVEICLSAVRQSPPVVADQFFEIAVRGRDDAHVHASALRVVEPFDLSRSVADGVSLNAAL